MKIAFYFFVFIIVVFLFGVAFGFTSRLIWEYKIYALTLVAGLLGYVFSRKAWMGAIIAVIAFFALRVIL
ncbi:MAG: hypothetical protein HXS54_01410 [Theionarchaea archaeon]|nr:hypothetical protein [Theionarchaea archaeon]